MSSYHCYKEVEPGVPSQYQITFPPDAIGFTEFRALLDRLENLIEPSDDDPLLGLRQLHVQNPRVCTHCPRLFVSHRQMDKQSALRVAWLANQHGFDYWLDILDPKVAAAAVLPGLTPYQEAVLMAAIIEMALLNCSHAIAVMTKNVPGTMWMPYEYGRVKDSALTRFNVGAWFDASWNLLSIPEYFHLGRQFRDEPGIGAWLDQEFHRYHPGNLSGICPSQPWSYPEPPKLT